VSAIDTYLAAILPRTALDPFGRFDSRSPEPVVDRRATQSGVPGAEILTFGSAFTGR
jgi:hypothetical protein